jgi:hypothetical protein
MDTKKKGYVRQISTFNLNHLQWMQPCVQLMQPCGGGSCGQNPNQLFMLLAFKQFACRNSADIIPDYSLSQYAYACVKQRNSYLGVRDNY